MTTRIGAAIAAGFLAVGVLLGAAGTVVVRDGTTTDMTDHMRSMSGTMSAGSMGNMAGMMSMMGGASMMGPNASMSPGDHESHHASRSPAATR